MVQAQTGGRPRRWETHSRDLGVTGSVLPRRTQALPALFVWRPPAHGVALGPHPRVPGVQAPEMKRGPLAWPGPDPQSPHCGRSGPGVPSLQAERTPSDPRRAR